jgi:hypothetical protein
VLHAWEQNPIMQNPNWTDVVTAVATALVPVLVLYFGVGLSRKVSRDQELNKVRLQYYKTLAPQLNRLMCYITFIGTWRDDSPAAMIALKRKLDSEFYAAAPLFSDEVRKAYENLMKMSFSTFGYWGEDAQIMSSAFRRRQAWRNGKWHSKWNASFAVPDEVDLPLVAYRHAYDALLALLVKDIRLNSSRTSYTTAQVSMNASAPGPAVLEGRMDDLSGRSADAN